MKKELIKDKQHSVALNVTAGKIDSFRELEQTTGTVRVYENGYVGIAGCLGEPDVEELTAKAKDALAFKIPYPWSPDAPVTMEERHDEEIIPIPEFIPTMQDFLDRLGALCPRFALSNKIRLVYNHREYQSVDEDNSTERHLVSTGGILSLELLAQNRGSGNLFDTILGWSGKDFDVEYLLSNFKKQYDAFYTPASLEPGRYPVLTDASSLFGTFIRQFSGDLYYSGASLLSGKLGQQVFSGKFTLRNDLNPSTAPDTCFFDAEGVTAPDFRPTLVEKGVLKGLLTTKKTARQYQLPNLGTASAPYDSVPRNGFQRYWLDPTARSLKELVPGKAVYVVVASGGDITPDGHYSTPVQMAYLVEDGELVGRLPDLQISGNFFEMFGKDYIGAVHGDPQVDSVTSALFMNVEMG